MDYYYIQWSMISTEILQNFPLKADLDMKVHYPEYELVLNKYEQYYNWPLINFKYDNNISSIQIPFCEILYSTSIASL